MRKVTRQLITDFKIEELGFDFMGYEVVDSFEREYSGIERNGKPLIQEEYLKRVLKKNI